MRTSAAYLCSLLHMQGRLLPLPAASLVLLSALTCSTACCSCHYCSSRLQVLGRLASHLSVILQGKDKPTYARNLDDGDVCIVVNAKNITLTGRRMADKKYTGIQGNARLGRLCLEARSLECEEFQLSVNMCCGKAKCQRQTLDLPSPGLCFPPVPGA